jgi:hypothetical protein
MHATRKFGAQVSLQAGSIQQDVGLTTGAKVIGDRLFVTSGKNISIYDISDPASPKWAGEDDVLYSIDYQRGIDILRYRGEHYVPARAARERPGARDQRRDAADRADRGAESATHRAGAGARSHRLVAGALLPRGAGQVS